MKKILPWLLSFIIAAGAMFYQRMTGPTYPMHGKVDIGGTVVKYSLPRSAVITTAAEVSIPTGDTAITGTMEYKRYKTDDPFKKVALERKGDALVGYLPKQPRAGKLAYQVSLTKGDATVALAGRNPTIVRFRGEVPVYILIPHVLFMLLALLFSVRAGLEALDKTSEPQRIAKWAAVCFFISGFILGPLMQYYGFGLLWTGFPLGHDLTDNKTLVAMIIWIVALRASRKGKAARAWILGAAILFLVVFLIPHSVMGSELDYSKMTPPAKIAGP